MLNNPWIFGGGPMTQVSNQMETLGGSGHMVVQTQSVSIASSDGSLIHQTNTYESWVTVTGPPPMSLDLGHGQGPAPSIYSSLDMGGTPTITSRAPDTYLAVPTLNDSISAASPAVAVSVQSPFVAQNQVESIVALPPMAVSEPSLVASVQNPTETYIAVPVPPACDPLVAMPAVQNLYNPIVGNPEPTVPIMQTSVPQATQTNAPSWYLVVPDMPDATQSISSTVEPSSVIRTDDDLFLCMRCNSTFEKASCINWHLRECRGDGLKASTTSDNTSSTVYEAKTLQCSMCVRLFTVLHETSTTFICSDCSSSAIPLTFSFGAQPIPQFKCSDCGDCFQFESELEDHQLSHRSSVTICELPDNYVEENGNEEDNTLVIVEPTVESPEDNDRSGSFASDSSDDVEPEHHYSECCGECGGAFPCRESFDQHLKTHEDIRSYGCTKCGTICVGRYSLNRHVWAHSREAADKDSKADGCFEEHEEDTKDGNFSQPFGCTECGMQFSNSDDLKEHCVSHLRSKPFLCTRCGEKFENTSSLERHWEAHTVMME